tara:strand:- start:1192 stop:1344 length:153 start_codon:yes stop_codon:yes gene_type:complete
MAKNILKFVKEEWKFLLTTLVLCVFTIMVVIYVAFAIFYPEVRQQPLGIL